MISRTPPKKSMISLPIGRLIAVTRKKNDIESIFNGPNIDREEIIKLYGEYLQKVETLLNDCDQIASDDPSSKEAVDEWFGRHKGDVNKFRNKMQAYIDRDACDQSVKPKVFTQPDKYSSELLKQASATSATVKSLSASNIALGEQARALSPDRASIKSITSSCKSNSSVARFKLAEKKAQVSAEKVYQNKLIQIEEDELKNKIKRKKIELEKQELEASILQTELDKLDGIADTLDDLAGNIPLQTDYNASFPDPPIEENIKFPFIDNKTKYTSPQTIYVNNQNPPSNGIDETPRPTRQSTNAMNSGLNSTEERRSRPRQASEQFLGRFQNNEHFMNSTGNPFDMSIISRILQKQNDISLRLVKNQEKATLPKKEIQLFDGNDITKYRRFINTFMLQIHNK